MSAIPIEQQGILIVSLITLLLTGIGGAGYLFRLWVLQKLAEDKAEMQNRFDDDKAKREREHLELQAQLDATQSGREMMRLQSADMMETRNAFMGIIKTVREDALKRDEQSANIQKESATAYQGIQANTAATLEFLKLHAENDNIFQIRQERMITQNEGIHARLLEVASNLDALIIKVDGLAVGNNSSKAILQDIQSALALMQDAIKRLEQVERIAETIPINPQVLAMIEVSEVEKELNQNTNNEGKP